MMKLPPNNGECGRPVARLAACMLAICAFLSHPATAQTTHGEIDPAVIQAAQAKLDAKQQADYPRIVAENQRLRREVEDLRKQLADLKRQFDELSPQRRAEVAR